MLCGYHDEIIKPNIGSYNATKRSIHRAIVARNRSSIDVHATFTVVAIVKAYECGWRQLRTEFCSELISCPDNHR